MKHTFIYMLLLCLSLAGQAHAQRYLPGMKGIQVTGGLSDHMRFRSGDGFGYHAGVAMATYTKNANRWVIGGEYLEKSTLTRMICIRLHKLPVKEDII